MKFNRKFFLSLIVLIIFLIVGYIGYQMKLFSVGVIEDARRLENFENPKEIRLTDSTTLILREGNEDSLKLER